MDDETIKRLESSGWVFTTVQELFDLSDEDMLEIERKMIMADKEKSMLRRLMLQFSNKTIAVIRNMTKKQMKKEILG